MSQFGVTEIKRHREILEGAVDSLALVIDNNDCLDRATALKSYWNLLEKLVYTNRRLVLEELYGGEL